MSVNAFGIIVAGRMVQTEFQQLDESKFLVTIPDAATINHIVVFLTGAQPFPDLIGGAVYFSWPDPSAPPTWQYLGFISNEKPSAIFKIAKLKQDGISNNPFSSSPFGIQVVPHVAQIGISIESLPQIQLLTPNVNAIPSTIDSFAEFVNKMLENFFNFATSFTMTKGQLLSSSSINVAEAYIPLSTVQQWYSNFTRRFQQNPTFWRT